MHFIAASMRTTLFVNLHLFVNILECYVVRTACVNRISKRDFDTWHLESMPSNKHMEPKQNELENLGKSSLPINWVHQLHLLGQEETPNRQQALKTHHSDGPGTAQNYFRRLAPTQLLLMMVRNICKAQ